MNQDSNVNQSTSLSDYYSKRIQGQWVEDAFINYDDDARIFIDNTIEKFHRKYSRDLQKFISKRLNTFDVKPAFRLATANLNGVYIDVNETNFYGYKKYEFFDRNEYYANIDIIKNFIVRLNIKYSKKCFNAFVRKFIKDEALLKKNIYFKEFKVNDGENQDYTVKAILLNTHHDSHEHTGIVDNIVLDISTVHVVDYTYLTIRSNKLVKFTAPNRVIVSLPVWREADYLAHCILHEDLKDKIKLPPSDYPYNDLILFKLSHEYKCKLITGLISKV